MMKFAELGWSKPSSRHGDLHFGLRQTLFAIEYPHFDQYAQADVEGRIRNAQGYGGIDRSAALSWRTRVKS